MSLEMAPPSLPPFHSPSVHHSSFLFQLQNNLTKKLLEIENAEHSVEIEKIALQQRKKVGLSIAREFPSLLE